MRASATAIEIGPRPITCSTTRPDAGAPCDEDPSVANSPSSWRNDPDSRGARVSPPMWSPGAPPGHGCRGSRGETLRQVGGRRHAEMITVLSYSRCTNERRTGPWTTSQAHQGSRLRRLKHRRQRRKDAEASPTSITRWPSRRAEAGGGRERRGGAGGRHPARHGWRTPRPRPRSCPRFGPKVAAIVAEVTDDKSLPKPDPSA